MRLRVSHSCAPTPDARCATVEAAVSERKVLQTVVSARAADGGAAPTAFFLSLAPFDYHRTQLWAVTQP